MTKNRTEMMFSKLRRDLDPLDNEFLERALESAGSAVKQNSSNINLDSDEQLEAELRRELIEIAHSYGASGAEILLVAKHFGVDGNPLPETMWPITRRPCQAAGSSPRPRRVGGPDMFGSVFVFSVKPI
jgi:hypothetical protein